MIAEPHHILARCRWQTRFDDQHQGFQLQEMLSYFSQQLMPEIIDRVLASFCGSQYHWRIERLNIDLGQLDYNDLLAQLPKRFSDALYTALWREMQKLPGTIQQQLLIEHHSHTDAPVNLESDFIGQISAGRITDRHSSALALMAYFWQYGRLPWWQRHVAATTNQQQLFEQQMTLQADNVVALLRRLGLQSVVRQRIAYQYQQNSIKRLIALLEPHYHQQIIAFGDDLQQAQQRKKLVNTSATEFAKVRWYWILTHLLVERGSVFDTKMFILSTLKQMANHYNVGFDLLLQQVLKLTKLNFVHSSNKPQFILALEQLACENDIVTVAEQRLPLANELHWQNFGELLQQGVYLQRNAVALFTDLARVDAGRMAKLLRRIAAKYRTGVKGFSQLLVKGLPHKQKYQLLEVLAPDHHLFIVSHIDFHQRRFSRSGQQHTQTVEPQRGNDILWQVVVAYLLKQSSSYFSREQFVRHTIEDLAKGLNISYRQLLMLLRSQIELSGYISHQLEIAKILCSLHHNAALLTEDKLSEDRLNDDKLSVATTAQQLQFKHYIDALVIYLTTGKLPNQGILNSPQQLWQLLSANCSTASGKQQLLLQLTPAVAGKALSASVWQRLYQLIDLNDCQSLILATNSRLKSSLKQLLIAIEQGETITNVAGIDIEDFYQDAQSIDKLLLTFSLLQTLLRQSVAKGQSHDIGKITAAWLELLTSAYGIGHNSIESKQDSSLAGFIAQLRLNGELTPSIAMQLQQWPKGQSLSFLQQQSDGRQLMRVLIQLAQGTGKVASLVRRYLQALWPYPNLPLSAWLQVWAKQMVAKGDVAIGVNQLVNQLQQGVWLVLLDNPYTQGLHFHSRAKQWQFWQQLLESISAVTQLNYQRLIERLTQLNYAALSGVERDINFTELNKQQVVDRGETNHQGTDWSMVLQFYLLNGRMPVWVKGANGWSLTALMSQLLKADGQALLAFIAQMVKQHHNQAHWRARLYQLLASDKLLALLQNSSHLSVLVKTFIKQLSALSHLTGLAGIKQNQYRYWLWLFVVDKLLPAIDSHQQGQQITINGANIVNAGQLLACLLVDISTKSLVTPLKLVEQLADQNIVSRAILTQLNACIEAQPESLSQSPIHDKVTIEKAASDEEGTIEAYTINNAGLVLLQGFIRPYFSRLGLTENDQFTDKNASIEAVHYLQYLATGQLQTEEQHLLLNKIMLGIPTNTPLSSGIVMTADQRSMADGLIEAVIGHWGAIGKSSIDGFRGNWLVRDGVLTEDQECWILQVEKKPYDLLLERFPLAFRQIRLPWMDKLLTVEWQS